MTMIVVAVIAVALLIALTVWRVRMPNSDGPGESVGTLAQDGGRKGPAGADRFGGGFGGGWG